MLGLTLNQVLLGLYYMVSVFLGFFEFIVGLGCAKLYVDGYGDATKLTLKFAFCMTLATILILNPISKLYF